MRGKNWRNVGAHGWRERKRVLCLHEARHTGDRQLARCRRNLGSDSVMGNHPKLSAETEQAVLRFLADGLTSTAVAERFDVSLSTILRIKNKHLPPSVPVPSSKARVRRRHHHRAISWLKRQWLFHLVDGTGYFHISLAELADRFHTTERTIQKAISERKKLTPNSPSEQQPRAGGWCGEWRNEIERDP